MKMYVAHSYEIDHAQDAVQEILQALPLEHMQGKNVVGLLTTHTDAVSTGVVSAICSALPFDVIGMTSFASCANGEADLAILTLTVFVSEDVRFAVTLSDSLRENYTEVLDRACADIKNKLGEEPSLALVCAPFSRHISGQSVTSYLTKILGACPLFGGLASDHTVEAQSTYVFLNDQIFTHRVALLCMAGPVKARFALASLRPDSLQKSKATITASDGNTVYSVNDMPVMNYIYSLGLSSAELEGAGVVLPFLVDFNDGSPMVAREVLSVTSEKHLYFGGIMPTGAHIYLALQTPKEVLHTAQGVIDTIVELKENLDCAFIVSCAGRSVILGGDPLAEAQEALQALEGHVVYQHTYARGEICPVCLPSGKIENRFHNFTFSVCMFEKT